MYADYFGLREQPFNNHHDARYFFSTPEHEEALASLIYTVGEQKGTVVLTGEAGTGKTFLTRLMLLHFADRISFAEVTAEPPRSEAVSSGCASGSADFLASACRELGVDPESAHDPTLALPALQTYLCDEFARHRPVVLVIDDAHGTTVEALASLHALCHFQSQRAHLLQIILVGQPELCRTLHHPRLDSLRQRCFRCCELPPLARGQVDVYIGHHLSVAGGGDLELFDVSSRDAIYEWSGGIPRLINTLCDNVLLSAFASDRRVIDADFVRSVAAAAMKLHRPPAVGAVSRQPSAVSRQPPAVSEERTAVGRDSPADSVGRRVSHSDSASSPPTYRSVPFVHPEGPAAQAASIEGTVDALADRPPDTTAGEPQPISRANTGEHTPQPAPEGATSEARRAGEELAVRLARAQAIADQAILRIQDQSRKTKRIAAMLKGASDRSAQDLFAVTHGPDTCAPAHGGRRPTRRDALVRADTSRNRMATQMWPYHPQNDEGTRMTTSCGPNNGHPRRDSADSPPRSERVLTNLSSVELAAEHRIELLRERVHAAFSRSLPTERLMRNVRRLSRLAQDITVQSAGVNE